MISVENSLCLCCVCCQKEKRGFCATWLTSALLCGIKKDGEKSEPCSLDKLCFYTAKLQPQIRARNVIATALGFLLT